jgi:hypothetical protein
MQPNLNTKEEEKNDIVLNPLLKIYNNTPKLSKNNLLKAYNKLSDTNHVKIPGFFTPYKSRQEVIFGLIGKPIFISFTAMVLVSVSNIAAAGFALHCAYSISNKIYDQAAIDALIAIAIIPLASYASSIIVSTIIGYTTLEFICRGLSTLISHKDDIISSYNLKAESTLAPFSTFAATFTGSKDRTIPSNDSNVEEGLPTVINQI